MRHFLNAFRVSADIPKADAVQSQIDTMVDEINHINDIVHDTRNAAITRSNTIHDAMQQKGIQINNILKHQGKQDERIEELEKGMDKFKELLRAAFNTITALDNKVKALENQNVPQQSILDENAKGQQNVESCVPSRKRLKSTFDEPKYMEPFRIALELRYKGMIYSDIALELNKLNFKSPYGHEFYAQLVHHLLKNRIQRNKYNDSLF